MNIITLKRNSLALCILTVLPFQQDLQARSYIPEVIAGTTIAGIITLIGTLNWKSMTNAHLEREQALKIAHFEREKKFIDDVAAIDPIINFGSLIHTIQSQELCAEALVAYCTKNSIDIDRLYNAIVSYNKNAHDCSAQLKTHAETWRTSTGYEHLYPLAITTLEQRAAALNTLTNLQKCIEKERDYINLCQAYTAIDGRSYVYTQDPFGLIYAVKNMNNDATTLQNALDRITCHDIYDTASFARVTMVNKAAQKIDWLKQSSNAMVADPESREQQYNKLLADQKERELNLMRDIKQQELDLHREMKEKELAVQRKIVQAQMEQAEALRDRVRLEEKNYQRRIETLYEKLHAQQRVINLLENEITALRRLHGNDMNNAGKLIQELHKLQQQIDALENPGAAPSAAAAPARR